MSESIAIGAIGKNPNIDKVNYISEDGLKAYARSYAEDLFTAAPPIDAADGQGLRKLSGTRYREIPIQFPEV